MIISRQTSKKWDKNPNAQCQTMQIIENSAVFIMAIERVFYFGKHMKRTMFIWMYWDIKLKKIAKASIYLYKNNVCRCINTYSFRITMQKMERMRKGEKLMKKINRKIRGMKLWWNVNQFLGKFHETLNFCLKIWKTMKNCWKFKKLDLPINS